MINALFRGLKLLVSRPRVRILIQALVSLVLLGLLVVLAQRHHVLARLQTIELSTLAIVVGLHFAGTTINSLRWQILLRNVGVREPLARLTALYMIGQYVSLFLPTSAGGDAVRIYDVAHRSRRTAETVVATLQERLLALGAFLLIGLGATLYYLPVVRVEVRSWLLLALAAAAAGIALLLYPALPFALARRIWRRQPNRPALRRIVEQRLVVRVVDVLRPVAEAAPLTLTQLLSLFTIAAAAALLFVGMYYVVGQSLGIEAPFTAYCLVVPLVSIVRMLPVSLNGLGVGEGAFILLMGFFAVPEAQAVALTLAMLGLLTCLALAGGLVVAYRVARGTWTSGRRSEVQASPVAEETAGASRGNVVVKARVALVEEDQVGRRVPHPDHSRAEV